MASKKFWPRYGSDHSHRYIKKEGGGTIQSIWHHKASGKPGATSGDNIPEKGSDGFADNSISERTENATPD